jgi:stage V sporulation protein R
MREEELPRLKKIEERIYEIAREMGLKFDDIEFDIVPQEKMFEIMAYHMPGQISNWKYGRDYEKTRTIYEKVGDGLPFEVVVNTVPARAYLMRDNTFALQCLIIAHVVGHVAAYRMNSYHIENDETISTKLSLASERFEEYERKYGIDIVEQTVDAGHAIMLHSNPWLKDETEQDKLERIYERMKQKKHDKQPTAFRDFFEEDDSSEMDREKWNYALYRKLKNQTPVEPTEDLLRYIIDHSRALSDWQKDILETIRIWGQYVWPNIKTKYIHEGFATFTHERILRQLFKEGLLSPKEHSECNYCNSLVKAMSPYSMNPYLIGCALFDDIKRRWDNGQHGDKWEQIEDHEKKRNYDDGSMKGMDKVFEVLRTSNDWALMKNHLTSDLVRELRLYLYTKQSNLFYEELVIADKDAEEIRDIIVNSFSHSGIPKVFVIDGNYYSRGELLLRHEHVGPDLDKEYAQKTMEHIQFLWGEKCTLKTIRQKRPFKYVASKPKDGPELVEINLNPQSA